MTVAAMIVSYAVWLAMVMLVVAFLLTVWRVIKGPTLADRVVALDMLVGIAIGFIALIAIRTSFTLYIDIAISLGLVGFLATVAFARFILARGAVGETPKEWVTQLLAASQPVTKRKSRTKTAPGAKPAVRRKGPK